MEKKVQAKHITDERCLRAVRAARGRHGVADWSSLWDIQEEMTEYPAKVVQAKLASLLKRKILTGCACGCRGDFEEIK